MGCNVGPNSFPANFPVETHAPERLQTGGRGYIFYKENELLDSCQFTPTHPLQTIAPFPIPHFPSLLHLILDQSSLGGADTPNSAFVLIVHRNSPHTYDHHDKIHS